MAYVREEVAFRPVRPFESRDGVLQLPLRHLQLCGPLTDAVFEAIAQQLKLPLGGRERVDLVLELAVGVLKLRNRVDLRFLAAFSPAGDAAQPTVCESHQTAPLRDGDLDLDV